jgi:hypothetical protein
VLVKCNFSNTNLFIRVLHKSVSTRFERLFMCLHTEKYPEISWLSTLFIMSGLVGFL